MATQVQTRRGTTAQHSTFTGAAGELTVDTDKKTVVVHDGTTAGGAPLLRESGSQNAVTTGTSTAASFIPSSSTAPTNGVYLPAANTVGISTNGSGRLFVDASGNVGIGQSSVTAIYGRTVSTTESTGATLRIAGTTTSAYFFTSDTLGYGGLIQATNHPLIFGVNSVERLRIASGGAVGIGTSSPSATLHVAGATRTGANDTSDAVHQIGAGATGNRNAYVDLVGDTTYSTYGTRLLRLGGANAQSQLLHRGTGSFDFIAVENAPITFNTTNTERLRITSAGLVGVGTSNPGHLLHLFGSTGTTFGLALEPSGWSGLKHRFTVPVSGDTAVISCNYNGSAVDNSAQSTSSVTVGNGVVQLATGGINAAPTTRLHITAAGLVGIGTSSPISLLEVKSAASADCKQTVSVTTATQSAFTSFVNTTVSTVGTENSAGGNLVAGSSAYATILSNNGAYPIQFGTNNTVRATLDSSGRLGIGTTSPSGNLHVSASTAASIIVDQADGTSTNRQHWILKTANQVQHQTRSSTGSFVSVDYIADTGASGVNYHAWHITGTERARIDSSGRLLLGTTASTGATANTTPVIAGAFYLVQGSVTAANATATEIFVIPSGNATYIATAVIPNASDTTNYHATYLVGSNGSSNHLLTALDPGALLTMSLSGSSLRVTQSAGGASEVRWSVTRLATFP